MAETETATTIPIDNEFRLTLRLGAKRWLAIDPAPLQGRLDRVSKYMVRRLQRRHPQVAITRPSWGVQDRRYAHMIFTWGDIAAHLDPALGPCLYVVKDEVKQITVQVPQNRAERRAAGR